MASMTQLILSFFILASTTLSLAFGAEVDHFTRRNEALEDAGPLLNLRANKILSNSLKKLNNQEAGCDEDLLYKELRTYFANKFSGKFSKEIIETDHFPKREISIPESVYQDWEFFDGALLSGALYEKLGSDLSPVLRVGDVLVGSDKFEHMFGRGFMYFTKNYRKEKGVRRAIRAGIIGEKFILGGLPFETGVFSYADLSANFNGMRFWNHMLQENDDILGRQYNAGPFVICKNNRWVKGADIDFKNYIDKALDEGINCSKFTNQRALEKFKSRVESVGLSCPVSREAFSTLTAKYGLLSKWLINQDGNGVLKLTKEFKEKSKARSKLKKSIHE